MCKAKAPSGVGGPSADALKLTTYFGERQRTAGRFAADALLDLYGRGNRVCG